MINGKLALKVNQHPLLCKVHVIALLHGGIVMGPGATNGTNNICQVLCDLGIDAFDQVMQFAKLILQYNQR